MHYVKEEFYHVCLIDEIFFIFKTCFQNLFYNFDSKNKKIENRIKQALNYDFICPLSIL